MDEGGVRAASFLVVQWATLPFPKITSFRHGVFWIDSATWARLDAQRRRDIVAYYRGLGDNPELCIRGQGSQVVMERMGRWLATLPAGLWERLVALEAQTVGTQQVLMAEGRAGIVQFPNLG